MAKQHVPDAGEIVWMAGRRPALVLSPAAYNGKTNLMICCPLTTQIKNYPFEVFIGGVPPNAVLGRSGEEPRLAQSGCQTERARLGGAIDRSACEDIRAYLGNRPRLPGAANTERQRVHAERGAPGKRFLIQE